MSKIVTNLKRMIKVTPTMTADDNADNDVAFDWTLVPDAFLDVGVGATLQSVSILNGYDVVNVMELVFCRGGDDNGTAPTADQGLIGGATTGSAGIDITQAETQTIEICGNVNIVAGDYVEGDLITARIAQKNNIGMLLAPRKNSKSLYIGGIWRHDPDTMSSTGLMDIYLGFEY